MDAGVVLVKKRCVEDLGRVDAIIFDCDGVLIDVRESYMKAITESVAYFTKELFGIDFPPTNSLMEIIHVFKKSGGFNNEWDIVYALLLHLFHKLPKKLKKKFIETVSQFSDQTLSERFHIIQRTLRSQIKPQELDFLLNLGEAYDLAKRADSTGIPSIEREFNNSPDPKIFKATKNFLAYPGRVGESLLTTIFEELFCGAKLFEKQYGVKPQFHFGQGLINDEKRILTLKTLRDLASLMGQYNFGIATGRPRLLAKYTLGKILDKFNGKATVFIEDVLQQERKERARGVKTSHTKPNPFSLLKSAEGLDPFTIAAYVGDSAEDVLMVKRACVFDRRFLAVGVYSTSSFMEDLISNFVELEADIILPSIKELAGLLGETRREKG